MPHLDVEGAQLYYETDSHISSPALLLIHAGIANLRMWDPQVPTLAENHFVIRFDTRGYGQTTTEDVEFSNRADALDLLDHLGIQKATLIGCARGGGIAIDLAVENPDRVAGLLTIGSGPSGFPETELTSEEDDLFDQLDAAFEAGDWNTLYDLEVRLWCIGPTRNEADLDPDFVAAAYELNRMNIAHVDDRPVPIPLEPPAYDRLVDIAVPTFVMVGEQDLSAALTQYEYLLSTIPGADGATFRDSAHIPSVERPDIFELLLTGWLARHKL
ncbi:alpha/beta fold hydrolase [Glaciihabitans sp. UYNi722]|uniref:alpha/beta fold hydrolase n=1 Tax=Glaciihabitans sp. UYNi722 TaxID=3156344 RepID=UPI00339600BF